MKTTSSYSSRNTVGFGPCERITANALSINSFESRSSFLTSLAISGNSTCIKRDNSSSSFGRSSPSMLVYFASFFLSKRSCSNLGSPPDPAAPSSVRGGVGGGVVPASSTAATTGGSASNSLRKLS